MKILHEKANREGGDQTDSKFIFGAPYIRYPSLNLWAEDSKTNTLLPGSIY